MCRTTRLLAEMVDNKNSDDSVNLFCSSSCVMAFMVQTVSASGTNGKFSLILFDLGSILLWGHYRLLNITVDVPGCEPQEQFLTFNLHFSDKSCFFLTGARLNCDNCGKNTVPSYHLAMSDTTIRNFCTLPCVMAFQVMGFAPCKD